MAVLAPARGPPRGSTVDPDWPGGGESVSASNDFIRTMLVDVLRSQVPDAALLEKMVPHFPPFAKRARFVTTDAGPRPLAVPMPSL